MPKRQPDYDHKETQVAPTTRVKVTDADYAQAEGNHQYRCGIARAVQRERPQAKNVRANKRFISWQEGEMYYSYPTPQLAIEEIIKPIDTGIGELKPITLRLEGGYARPIKHHTEEELREMRGYMRDSRRRSPSGTSARNPAYERFINE